MTPKAIKEDQSISLSHALDLMLSVAPRKVFVGSKEEGSLSCGYALAWMSLARAPTLGF